VAKGEGESDNELTLAGMVASRWTVAPVTPGPTLIGDALARARTGRGRATACPTDAARERRPGLERTGSSSFRLRPIANSTLRSCVASFWDFDGRTGVAGGTVEAPATVRGGTGTVGSPLDGDKGPVTARSLVRNESLRTRPSPRRPGAADSTLPAVVLGISVDEDWCDRGMGEATPFDVGRRTSSSSTGFGNGNGVRSRSRSRCSRSLSRLRSR
jgi:hypothetical protein